MHLKIMLLEFLFITLLEFYSKNYSILFKNYFKSYSKSYSNYYYYYFLVIIPLTLFRMGRGQARSPLSFLFVISFFCKSHNHGFF